MKVLVTVTCKTEYSAVVEMTQDEFIKYDTRLDSHDRRVEEDIFMSFIDCDEDWQDDHDYEVRDFLEFVDE